MGARDQGTDAASAGSRRPRKLRLPPGRRLELRNRGTIFYREVAGPPGAPTLLLLHGWVASAGLNWFQSFETLGQHFRIIAPDLRGHGRGIRSWRRFRLSDCADDVAEMCTVLNTGPVIPVGYSMGGAVAQLLWRRHRHLVRGLVMTATSDHMVVGAREKFLLTTAMWALAGTTRVGQLSAHFPRQFMQWLLPSGGGSSPDSMARWGALEMARHDWRMLLEAGYAIGRHDATRWTKDIDVPTAVLVHELDNTLPADLQYKLAAAIPNATVHEIEDGHFACATPEYALPLLNACRDVAVRAESARPRRRRGRASLRSVSDR